MVAPFKVQINPPLQPLVIPSPLLVMILGHFFLRDKQDHRLRFRAHIIKLIKNHSSDIDDKKLRIKFLLINSNTKRLGFFSKDPEKDIVLKCIPSHQGPIATDHPDYKDVNVIEIK
jgi:hypothetical protein